MELVRFHSLNQEDKAATRGGVLEDVLGLEDVLEDTFWSPWPWPWPRRSSPWPWPRVLENRPVLGSRTALFFELLKFCGALEKFFGKRFFVEIAWKIFLKTFFFWRSPKKFLWRLFFCLESTCACVLGPWPWPRAFVSLASRVSVLGKAVLGLCLGFFFVSLALASSLVSSTPPLAATLD